MAPLHPPPRSTVGVIAKRAMLLVARSLAAAGCLLLLAWLAVAGTWRWRNDAAWAHFPPDFGCDDSAVLDSCTLQQMVWLVVAPALLALGAAGAIAAAAALQLSGAGGHVKPGLGTAPCWTQRLLPPRCAVSVCYVFLICGAVGASLGTHTVDAHTRTRMHNMHACIQVKQRTYAPAYAQPLLALVVWWIEC
jgi:hypothetical protein